MAKSGLDNLRTPSTEEAREIGRKGGQKSGEAKRARKTLREELLLLLSSGDWQERITTALLAKAARGDVKALEVLRDTIGERPTDKRELTYTADNPFSLELVVVDNPTKPDKPRNKAKNEQSE